MSAFATTSRYPPAHSASRHHLPPAAHFSLPHILWDAAGGPQFTCTLIGTALTLLAAFSLRRALLLKKVSSTPQHSHEVNWVFSFFVLWICSVLLVNAIAVGAGEQSAAEACVPISKDWPRLLATCIGSATHFPCRTSILWAMLLVQLLLSYVLFVVMVTIVVLGEADKKLGMVSKTALKQLCSALPSLCHCRSARRRRKIEIWSKILSACCDNSDVARQYLWTGPCLFCGSLISMMSQVGVMLHLRPDDSL